MLQVVELNKPKNGYFSAGGYVEKEEPDAKDKSEYSGGRSMAASFLFDPLQVFSKDKPPSEETPSGSNAN